MGALLLAIAAAGVTASTPQAMDGVAIPRVSSHAVLTAGRLSTDDYPLAARRATEQGETLVAYRVDAQGVPRDCRVLESSGSAALDRQTCTIVERRFRFRPARDRAGQPTEDMMAQSIIWTLPRHIRLVGPEPAARWASQD
jgi:TonB family protein